MAVGNFALNRVFSFSQLSCLFWKKNSSEIHVFRSDQVSLLMYRCLLPSYVTVKMDYEENMENARYATNDDTPL
jgi:transcription antitermination factor NusG